MNFCVHLKFAACKRTHAQLRGKTAYDHCKYQRTREPSNSKAPAQFCFGAPWGNVLPSEELAGQSDCLFSLPSLRFTLSLSFRSSSLVFLFHSTSESFPFVGVFSLFLGFLFCFPALSFNMSLSYWVLSVPFFYLFFTFVPLPFFVLNLNIIFFFFFALNLSTSFLRCIDSIVWQPT